MQSRLHILWMVILALLLTACQKNAHFIDSNGQPVNVTIHPNRWLLINYWAGWCTPCQQEIPELNAFYQKHRQSVLLYGVNFDHLPLEALRPLMQRLHMQYPALLQDPSEALHIDPVTTLPATLVFDPEGHLSQVLQGPQTEASLNAAIGAKK